MPTMTDQALSYSLFNTDEFKAHEKIEAYRENIGVIFDVDRIEGDKKDFKALIKGHLLSEIMLVECQTMAQLFERTEARMALDGVDHLLVQLFLSGKTIASEGDYECSDQNQALIILDSSRHWKAYNTKFRNLTLVVPRRLLQGKVLQGHLHHGRLLEPKHNPMAALLRSHMIGLHQNISQLKASDAHLVVAPCVELVAAALNFDEGRPKQSSLSYGQALLFSVKNYIEENLGDSQLGVEKILYQFKMSRSTLYRLFPPQTGGVMNYARERRLKHAFRSLLTSHAHGKRVAQIAFEAGFENESSFSRSFKSYFGLTPKDVKFNSSDYQLTTSAEVPSSLWRSWFLSL